MSELFAGRRAEIDDLMCRFDDGDAEAPPGPPESVPGRRVERGEVRRGLSWRSLVGWAPSDFRWRRVARDATLAARPPV